MKGFTSPTATSGGGGEDGKGAGGGSGVSGPFIYTPIGKKKKDNRPEVVWVEEEPGEIAVEIVNPLPFDLKVEKMVRKYMYIYVYVYVRTCKNSLYCMCTHI